MTQLYEGQQADVLFRCLKKLEQEKSICGFQLSHFLYPCYYGTDIDSQEKLIACHHSVSEIAKMIGADTLGFLPIETLEELAGSSDYCCACFDGSYPTKVLRLHF